ncbi:MAG TPA: hypothetical protein DEA96_06495 [Leptospiraceae bacterium]|nr:hypothetical protein [Spirochaetaceae bacterium]HBS04592.1 hypothetical protein [Leptospiraceae bacterium]|tara:strand:- start:6584 stop:7999 length:1416 start_codon:yes stop_codon:yes gene_type:complete
MQKFVITRPDGTEIQVAGYRAGNLSADRKKFQSKLGASRNLPERVDLRKYMTPIERQGDTNSCVANATAGAYEYLLKRHRPDEADDVSRLFLYFNARALEQNDDIESADVSDDGTYIQKCIASLEKFGVCSEETWPFDEDNVNEMPEDEAYDEASEFLVEDVALVPNDLMAWKSALAEGNPIIFGINLYNSFDRHRNGKVPMPTASEQSRGQHGGHAMLCVGYSDRDQVFIVRNSWGSEWGDAGYCYLPYRYVINDKFNDGDSWIIRRLAELEIDDETWDEEESESLLTDYESVLEEMSDEEYEEMLEDFGDVSFEERIALLLMYAADEDWETSEEELEAISGFLKEMLEAIGSDLDPRKVLRYAKRNYDNEDLIEESIELFAKHLSNEFLATLAADIEEIIGEDDLSEDEEAFIDRLVEEWQIEDEYEDEDEEYDEEEESDEEEYSGDDEEYDEDEDGEDDDDGSTGGRG